LIQKIVHIITLQEVYAGHCIVFRSTVVLYNVVLPQKFLVGFPVIDDHSGHGTATEH